MWYWSYFTDFAWYLQKLDTCKHPPHTSYITCISVPSQTRYSRTPAGWRSRRRWRWSLWSWSSRTWSWSSRTVWLRSGRGRWRWLLGSARCPATWIRKWRWEQWRSWRVGADLGNLVGDSEELWDPRLVGQAAEGGAWADRGNGNVGDHHLFHVNMMTMLMIMVLVVKGTYLQKTAEWVCSCWTVRSRAGETQKLFLTQALDAARGSERINCCNEDLTIELVVMVKVWHLAVAAKSVAEKRKES